MFVSLVGKRKNGGWMAKEVLLVACSIPQLEGPDRNRGLFQHDETQMAVWETTPDMSQVTF